MRSFSGASDRKQFNRVAILGEEGVGVWVLKDIEAFAGQQEKTHNALY